MTTKPSRTGSEAAGKQSNPILSAGMSCIVIGLMLVVFGRQLPMPTWIPLTLGIVLEVAGLLAMGALIVKLTSAAHAASAPKSTRTHTR
jgi:hypothetical protein